MKTILGLIMAAALVSPSVLVSPSQAAMRAMPSVAPSVAGEAPVTLIAEGCGPGFERGHEGRCRPSPRAREDQREDWRERRAREYRWRERERERVSVGFPRGYHYRERDGRCWQN